MKTLKILLLLVIITSLACKKDTGGNTPPVDDTIYSSSPCTISELIWMNDNITVLINDRCNGIVKFLNTQTKVLRNWNSGSELLVQKFFYTKEVPGKAFFTALSKNASGVFAMPYKLYSLDISNFSTTLIRDGISENPSGANYILGSKKLAVKDPSGTLLIDLESGTTQVLNVTGDVQALSPDNSKLLFYPNYSNYTSLIANAFVYDLSCNCSQPINLNGYGRAIWRTPGIFSYGYNSNLTATEFQNLQAGTIIKSLDKLVAGPWISNGSNLVLLYQKASTSATDQDAVLQTFNLATNQLVDLVHEKFWYSSYLVGITNAALSPDETKVAYVVGGSQLKVISR